MQVETESTVSVGEALDTISDDSKAIRIEEKGKKVFVRYAGEDDHWDGFLVNTVIPVIEERRTVVVEKEKKVRDVVAGAETARVVRVNNTPWSPLYEDT